MASVAWFNDNKATKMLKVKLEENPANNVEDFEEFQNREVYPENNFQDVSF